MVTSSNKAAHSAIGIWSFSKLVPDRQFSFFFDLVILEIEFLSYCAIS